MGHSLGVGHANAWVCADNEVLYGNCSHMEYGNYFDVMGLFGYSLNFNGFFKEKLGWIGSSQKELIRNSGIYTINPLELNEGKQLAKIYIKGSEISPYSIEFRRGVGFDSKGTRKILSMD